MTNISLDQRVSEKRTEIHTDSYPMSIGEIVNLYQDGDLDIHPEFQRIYRWNDIQKTRLIESILLGIPLPSFFVAQRNDGVWDVVDGLQRLSTIFSFLGIYKDENGQVTQNLVLKGTEYLPELEGKVWSDDFGGNHLSVELQRAFKREKIDLKIIKKESDDLTKYELFQRLNTYGSSLSDQEVRNCLLIMINKDFYNWLITLADYENFKATIPLTSKQIDEQYHVELVVRFLILKTIDVQEVRGLEDIGEFLTKKLKALAENPAFSYDSEELVFKKTFDILNGALGDNSFRKYQVSKYSGPFSLSYFELIALGLGFHVRSYDTVNAGQKAKIIGVSESLMNNEEFVNYSGSGNRAATRLPHLLPLGRSLFEL